MRIGICSWSLHRQIPKKIELLDFPKLCKERFGLSFLEPCAAHFASTDEEYLRKVRKAIEDVGGSVINIPVDAARMAEPDEKRREEMLEVSRKWLRIADFLGSPTIRLNTGGEKGDRAALSQAIQFCKALIPEVEKTGVKILIENHGGLSGDPKAIVEIIEGVGKEYMGSCPDFGNFPSEIRYEALEKIVPFAPHVHGKTYAFDEKGDEKTVDFGRCLDILKKNGYDGFIAIEFEGEGDEYEGVLKSKSLLERYI